jgi:hypothetical protein
MAGNNMTKTASAALDEYNRTDAGHSPTMKPSMGPSPKKKQ